MYQKDTQKNRLNITPINIQKFPKIALNQNTKGKRLSLKIIKKII